MKNIYLFLLLLSGLSQAQIINFPDPAFKGRLLNTGPNISWALDINLQGISIDADQDGEITVAEAQQVNQLYVSNAGISDLTGIEYFTNMELLVCDLNSLTTLDVSMLSQLKHLNCSDNNLSNVVINNTLEAFIADGNQITAMDFSNHLVRFALISLYGNLLTSLTVNDFGTLIVSENLLTSLNVSGDYNILHCQGNQLTTLDLSNARCMGFNDIHAENNPLSLLILKNGHNESTGISLFNYQGTIPNDIYVCADEDEIAAFETEVASLNMTNWMIGSYCSFTPGGDYNTINGTVTFDSNNNGCDSGDIQSPLFKVTINDGINTGSSFANASGNYQFFTGAGNFTLTPAIENAAWFNFNPSNATINLPLNDNSVTTQDFCMTVNGIHPDVQIVIVPIVPARPGFDAVYKLVFKNKGNQTLSGTVDFTFDDAVLDVVSSVPSFDNQSTNLLSFNYTNLLPFETRSILVTLNVNGPTDTPPVNNDDVLAFSATINPVAGDELAADNTFAFNQVVVGSFDPNNKTCLEGEVLHTENIGGYLHYNINFENEGTADAVNVVVKDILDITKFDISTLQIIEASHPMRAQLQGNKLEFIFENINLPPSSANPIGGHGNVLFKIKTWPNLQAGDMVTNMANIYFDYNHPVETNEATSTFSLLKNEEFKTDASIGIAPNPTKDKVNIKANSNIKNLQLFDIQGRLLQASTESNTEVSLDLSAKSNGIYFLKVTTEKGSKVEKILKE